MVVSETKKMPVVLAWPSGFATELEGFKTPTKKKRKFSWLHPSITVDVPSRDGVRSYLTLGRRLFRAQRQPLRLLERFAESLERVLQPPHLAGRVATSGRSRSRV